MCMEKFNPASRSGRIGTSKIFNRYRAEDSPSRSFTDYVAPLPLSNHVPSIMYFSNAYSKPLMRKVRTSVGWKKS